MTWHGMIRTPSAAAVVAELEAVCLGRPPGELRDHLDVEVIARRAVAGADVVHPQEAELSIDVERHAPS